jgi:hypothetical protein
MPVNRYITVQIGITSEDATEGLVTCETCGAQLEPTEALQGAYVHKDDDHEDHQPIASEPDYLDNEHELADEIRDALYGEAGHFDTEAGCWSVFSFKTID